VLHTLAGVVGPGDEAAVAKERPVGGEAADVVDLELQRERADLAHAGDPEQPLHVGVGDEARVERPLQLLDLALEEFDLIEVAAGLKLHELREVGHVLHVHLLEEPGDGVQRAHAALDQRKPSAEDVAEGAKLVGDHVGRSGSPTIRAGG
jgi:hypothetical protein